MGKFSEKTNKLEKPRMKPNYKHQMKNFIMIAALAGMLLFALSPARAVTPPPEGGYAGDNTALGNNALFSLNTSQGFYNVAAGSAALYWNTTGGGNTAIGSFAMVLNTTGGSNTALGDDSLGQNTVGN